MLLAMGLKATLSSVPGMAGPVQLQPLPPLLLAICFVDQPRLGAASSSTGAAEAVGSEARVGQS